MMQIENWLWQDFAELTSTNDKASELSVAPPAENFVVTAVRQTRGRGRRGRSWTGLDGNLFMSLGLPLQMSEWGQLVFVISLSLYDTIRGLAPDAPLQLKWPNDVLLNGAKISGILLEKGSGMYIIIGIGVNIAAAPAMSSGLIYSVSSLRQAGIEVAREDFLRAFLRCFNDNFRRWRQAGFMPVKERWLKYARGLHQNIRVNLPREVKTGIFRGIDDCGLLLLENASQIEKISAGDVFFEDAAMLDEKK